MNNNNIKTVSLLSLPQLLLLDHSSTEKSAQIPCVALLSLWF